MHMYNSTVHSKVVVNDFVCNQLIILRSEWSSMLHGQLKPVHKKTSCQIMGALIVMFM